MARYIKANKKVAEYLDLTRDRNRLPDGNYLLWQADILKFGRLTELSEICARVGAIALQPHEARQEQDGTVCRTLPTATDEEFAMPVAEEEPAEQPTEEPEAEPQADNSTATPEEPTEEGQPTESGTESAEAQPEATESEPSGATEADNSATTPEEPVEESGQPTDTENQTDEEGTV